MKPILSPNFTIALTLVCGCGILFMVILSSPIPNLLTSVRIAEHCGPGLRLQTPSDNIKYEYGAHPSSDAVVLHMRRHLRGALCALSVAGLVTLEDSGKLIFFIEWRN